jgi:hypothetical protein
VGIVVLLIATSVAVLAFFARRDAHTGSPRLETSQTSLGHSCNKLALDDFHRYSMDIDGS